MTLSGRTAVYGLIGRPVRHSLSPAIHNGLFRQFGIDAVYVPFEGPELDALSPGALLSAVRALGVHGVNVTAPFKRAVLQGCDVLDPSAEASEASNCVVRADDGTWVAHNTDGEGFCRAYEERWGADLRGRAVLLLGAGGSASAIAASLGPRGVRSLVVLNRTEAAGRGVLDTFQRGSAAASGRVAPFDAEAFAAAARDVDLVIHCAAPEAVPVIQGFPLGELRPGTRWCDLAYGGPPPRWSEDLRATGGEWMDGLSMLIHQAALSFKLFTGIDVPPAAVRAQVS